MKSLLDLDVLSTHTERRALAREISPQKISNRTLSQEKILPERIIERLLACWYLFFVQSAFWRAMDREKTILLLAEKYITVLPERIAMRKLSQEDSSSYLKKTSHSVSGPPTAKINPRTIMGFLKSLRAMKNQSHSGRNAMPKSSTHSYTFM